MGYATKEPLNLSTGGRAENKRINYHDLASKMGVTDYKMPNAHLYSKHEQYQKNNAQNRTHIDKSVVKHHTDVNGDPKSRYYSKGGAVDRQGLAAGAVAKIRKGQYNY
jgi:hypothetical protein